MTQTAQQTIDVGVVVGGTYRVTGRIGEGGMGQVWAAEHLRIDGKVVAIKVLNTAGDAEAVARFRREAEIASQLGHPNIVQVHDLNELPDGRPYMVLEYLEGEDLSDRLKLGPLSLSEGFEVLRQVASALRAAHKAGVVHRDLKPSNVFLSEREVDGELASVVKVLDFGISKIQGSNTVKTQTAAVLGTPMYMAPEQATGKHELIDGRTDVFALGVMAYELFAGQPPFGGQTIPEVVFKVVYEEAPPLAERAPHLPEAAVSAIQKAMAKERDERWSSMQDFVKGLGIKATSQIGAISARTGGAVKHTGPGSVSATVKSDIRGAVGLVDSGLDATVAVTGDEAAAITGANSESGASSVATDSTVAAVTAGDGASKATASTNQNRFVIGAALVVTIAVGGVLAWGALKVPAEMPGRSGVATAPTREPATAAVALATQPKPDTAAPLSARASVAQDAGVAASQVAVSDKRTEIMDAAAVVVAMADKSSRNARRKPKGRKKPAVTETDNKASEDKLVEVAAKPSGPVARKALKEAREAFAAGDLDAAEKAARIAARNGGGEAASAVLTAIHCRIGNATGARAAYRRLRSRKLRARAQRQCAKDEIELE